MFTLCVYILILVFIIIHFIFKFIVKIQLGTPPIGSLVIAYKYSCNGLFKNFKFFRRNMFSFSSYSSVRLYYTDSKAKNIEYAHGVILSESGAFPDDHLLYQAKRNGFSFIRTPAIPHAIYIVFPIFISLTITKIFAIFVGYPKIRHFAEERNLCGYPVLEIYSKRSVALVVPLIRQDEFVVHEAANIVYGREFCSVYNSYNDVNLLHFQPDISKQSFITQDLKNNKVTKLVKRETKG